LEIKERTNMESRDVSKLPAQRSSEQLKQSDSRAPTAQENTKFPSSITQEPSTKSISTTSPPTKQTAIEGV
jgi:hypothetical protein